MDGIATQCGMARQAVAGGLPAENGTVINNIFSGSNTSGIQTAFASQQVEPAWRAMDGDPGTRWSAFNPNPSRRFGIDFGQDEVVYSVRIKSSSAIPTDFLVQSSNDNASWETRLTVSGATPVADAWEAYSLSTPASARYWQIDVYGTSSTGVSIHDLEFKS